MSVDDRLRDGLADNARSLEPDVEALLDSALTAHRRARWLRWAGATGGLVAAACAGVAVVWAGWGGDRGGAPAAPAPAETSASIVLQGRYAGTVDALPAAPGVAGRWLLDFEAHGVLGISAPDGYPGVVSGVLYAVQGQELRTDLFSQDLCAGLPLGRYAVARAGATLTLTATDDRCPARVGVLAATAWAQTP